ncbi:MAG: flagellar M-ring protein FliF, partial [Oxalobacter sp.]|nr:flagellar M-ring protein FliF [Oxalobacter sp.]
MPPAADAPASAETQASGISARIAQARERLAEPRIRNIALIVGIAVVIAIMAGIWTWTQKTEYGVLYSGFAEKDGGAIISTLEQMQIPYKVTNGGGSILVPVDMVHGLRLKLASEGLPKASGVGFEVLENQKIGSSQFLEQVNFQRALEGELGRTIQSMEAIQNARVHLAMHKAS